MTSNILLKIASLIIFLHAMGHTMGIYTWQSAKSAVPKDLIQQMQAGNFMFGKTPANMADFYTGMGYAATIALLFVAYLLWISPKLSVESANYVVYGIIVFLIILGILELRYFFPMAAIFSFLAAAIALIAQYIGVQPIPS
jgi:hypothetical protein